MTKIETQEVVDPDKKWLPANKLLSFPLYDFQKEGSGSLSSLSYESDFDEGSDCAFERRILIVDDEPYNLMGLRVLFNAADEGQGINDIVDQAKDGAEALEAVSNARGFQYGLVIMDCSMPIMDGYQAAMKIRELDHIEQPKIIACTGHSEPEYIKKAFRHHYDELVEKPATV